MTSTSDVIVIGVGSMGAATCWRLAARRVRVVGLEQFSIPHALGSQHGGSRMIRLAYFEHPDYVALLRKAYALWDQLALETGAAVLHRTGGLYLGRPDGALVGGSLRAAREHGLDHELLSARDVAMRFPQFRLPDDAAALWEPEAGYLVPEAAVAACAARALALGAELRAHERVVEWRVVPGGVEVRTDRAHYAAARLVITAGPWAARVVGSLGVPLRVTRQVVGWYAPRRPEQFTADRFPCWALDPAPASAYRGLCYGFPLSLPASGMLGLKAAWHAPGQDADPDTVDRAIHTDDLADVEATLAEYLPDAVGPLLAARVCLYTNSPDGHFLLDHLPSPGDAGPPRVALAAGFSGHGFKFASVVGEALAELALDGRSTLPIGFLSLRRFASTAGRPLAAPRGSS